MEKTYIAAFSTMNDGSPRTRFTSGTSIHNPHIGQTRGNHEPGETLDIGSMRFMNVKPSTFLVREKRFNGMITNDKFCCTRWGQLQLSWWRRPLRLRGGAGPEPR